MICLYLVNEEPSYIGMLSLSLKQLRQYNPNVSVVVYYVQDGRRDTRQIGTQKIRQATQHLPGDYHSFVELCKELDVEIRVRKPPQKESYFSLHRILLQEVEDQTVLLLDGDTFFYGNIEQFPEIYSGFDFVATPNNWGMVNPVPGLDPNFKSFNSGVVLCQNGTLKRWADTIGDYCDRLKNREHPLSEWLWSVSENCAGREELAASLFILDHGLKYTYFEDQHVQMGQHIGETLILHTLTPNWLEFYNKYFAVKKRKFLLKPITFRLDNRFRLENNTDSGSCTNNDLDEPPQAPSNASDTEAK